MISSHLGRQVSHVSWLLGARHRWIWTVPAVSVAAAALEVLLLVAVVRMLLLLVDPASTATIGLGPISADLGFSALAAMAIGCSAALIALRVVDGVVIGWLASEAASNARERLIDTYFAADWRAMARLRAGHLQQLLGNNVQVAADAVPKLGTNLTALINLLVYGAFVAISSPVIGVVFAAAGAVVVVLFSAFRSRTRSVAGMAQTQIRDLQLAATSLSSLNRELQLFDVQEAARAELLEMNSRARTALRRLRTNQKMLPPIFQQIVLLGVVGLVVLAREVSIDASSFGTAAILAVRSLSYLQQLNSGTQSYIEAAPYLDEIEASVSVHSTERRDRGSVPLEVVERLELAGVGFTYESAEVLSDVSLQVDRGDWLGVVGPSGGGKTTLAMLLGGLVAPSGGEYLVNNRPASEYTQASWASTFALLSQEPVLIRGSIEENIRFYRGGSRQDVLRAAERAAIAVDIEALPEGWETQVGDGRASLSGGQRQRIALARALYGHPQVLILDEPTSALDALSEHLIEESLFALGRDVVVIVVSHRPTLLARCNRFLVVQDGRIAADGPRSEVALERYVGAIPEQQARDSPPA